MLRHSKKLTAGLGIVTAGLLSTGVAFAAWSSSGTGSGTAKSTTSVDSAISGDSSALANLYPGAEKTIKVTIDNPNDYPVQVTKIDAGFSKAIGADATLCAAGTVQSLASGTGSAALVPVGGTASTDDSIAGKTGGVNGSRQYTLTVRMANDASDNCKSKTFELLGATGTGTMSATLRSAAVSVGTGF